MIVYNYDADLEVSDTCVRSSLLSWVELSWRPLRYVSRLILLKQVPLRYVSYSQTQDRIVLFSVVDGGKITFIVLSI